MKRFLSLFLCLTLLLTALSLVACSGGGGGGDGDKLPSRTPPAPPSEGLEYKLETASYGSYYVVTGMGTCTDTLVVIPDTYNGQPVRGIAAGAFHAQKAAPAVTPTAAGGTRVSQTGGVRPMAAVTVRPVDEPTDTPEAPAEHEITEIFIPDSVTEIGDEAFLDCEKLASIDTARLVSMIGTDAFKNTAFYLDEANWVDGVLYLENYLVDVRDSFEGKLTVREGTLHVADRALAGHMGITEVVLPSSIRVVGNYAFTDCLNLTAINLDHPGIQIGNHAFAGCISLVSVKISTDDAPTSPESGDLPQYTINPDANIGGGIIITPGTGSGAGTGEYKPGGSVSVGGMGGGSFFALSTFAQESTLDPDFIYSGTVGANAFDGCISLTSVSFGKNVGQIDGGAFSGCTALTSVDMSPISFTSQGGGMLVMIKPGSFAFSSEATLSSTFENCTALTSVILPAGLTAMTHTFIGCTSLTSFTVPEGVKFLDGTFRSCTALTSVTLPSTLTRMNGTFRFCPSLASVEIPATVTEIGVNTFRDCESLDSLYLPDAVTEIGEQAFLGMKKDAVISIGPNVRHIDANAASMLYAVTYRGTVEQWNEIDLDANWMGDRVDSSIAIYCQNGTIGEEPEHDKEPEPDKPGVDTPVTPPERPEMPIPEWIAEIEAMILPNEVIYFRYHGVTLRLTGTHITSSPISFNELQKNPPEGAREMTEREKADVFDEKLMESVRHMTEK